MKKVTVKQLIKRLQQLPQDYEVVIYPKYAKVDGYKKHRFRLENVVEQEPYGATIKKDPDALKNYFGRKKPELYEVNNHVAIIF